jgi:hypothetical protein
MASPIPTDEHVRSPPVFASAMRGVYLVWHPIDGQREHLETGGLDDRKLA